MELPVLLDVLPLLVVMLGLLWRDRIPGLAKAVIVASIAVQAYGGWATTVLKDFAGY